jgi:hypothetical protein
VVEDRRATDDIQIGVLLSRERGGRQVLRRGARSNGARVVLAEPDECVHDCGREIVGDGDRLDRCADLCAQRTDRVPVGRRPTRQLIEQVIDRRRVRHDALERARRDAKAGRHMDPLDP